MSVCKFSVVCLAYVICSGPVLLLIGLIGYFVQKEDTDWDNIGLELQWYKSGCNVFSSLSCNASNASLVCSDLCSQLLEKHFVMSKNEALNVIIAGGVLTGLCVSVICVLSFGTWSERRREASETNNSV